MAMFSQKSRDRLPTPGSILGRQLCFANQRPHHTDGRIIPQQAQAVHLVPKNALPEGNHCPIFDAMATLQRFDSCRVMMYLDDHPPPHVHVKLRDGRDCTVDLGNLGIKGRVAEREIREALGWIKSKQIYLLDEWQRNNP
jgi:hypothetical protein